MEGKLESEATAKTADRCGTRALVCLRAHLQCVCTMGATAKYTNWGEMQEGCNLSSSTVVTFFIGLQMRAI